MSIKLYAWVALDLLICLLGLTLAWKLFVIPPLMSVISIGLIKLTVVEGKLDALRKGGVDVPRP